MLIFTSPELGLKGQSLLSPIAAAAKKQRAGPS
jgi:hypothetical protein